MQFLNNKYTKWYYNIIQSAKSRTNLPTTTYTENHHIMPKSLKGNNSASNLVTLTAREHFLCHLLLTKMVGGEDKYKMYFAFGMMMSGHITDRYVPSRFYSKRRELVGKASSFFNSGRPAWNNGIPRTDQEKFNIANSLTGRIIGPHSPMHKEKLSVANKGKHKHVGINNPMFGKTQTTHSKKSMSDAKRKTFIISDPTGKTYKIEGTFCKEVTEFCKSINVSARAIAAQSKEGAATFTKGNSVGWKMLVS